jgi:hypothetical protein
VSWIDANTGQVKKINQPLKLTPLRHLSAVLSVSVHADSYGSYDGGINDSPQDADTSDAVITGAFQLHWDAPGGTAVAFVTHGSTSTSTPHAPDGLYMAFPNHVQFYEYCPQWDGHVSFDTCHGTHFDSHLDLFLADETLTDHASQLVGLTVNDDSCGSQSKVESLVTAGRSYYIAGMVVLQHAVFGFAACMTWPSVALVAFVVLVFDIFVVLVISGWICQQRWRFHALNTRPPFPLHFLLACGYENP